MAVNINRVVLTGNLTADPELRSLPSGMAICKLRIACNSRKKDGEQWVDKPNYFDVTVWGGQGENCARYLAKGRPVAVDGRLEWREWTTPEGQKRQAVDIVADSVQFLSSPEGGQGGGGGQGAQGGGSFAGRSDVTVDTNDFGPPAPVGGGASTGDDDIPF